MAKKKVGELIREARTEAGLTQEKLAKSVPGISANDISKAERGELLLTQEQLKLIAKATGVTQKSLLEAAAGSKTAATKTGSSKAASKSSTSGTSMKVTAAEKKLLELYRAADADTKKKVVKMLKGDTQEASELISALLGSALEQFMK